MNYFFKAEELGGHRVTLPKLGQPLNKSGYEVVKQLISEDLLCELRVAAGESLRKLKKHKNVRSSTKQTEVAHHVLSQSDSYLRLLRKLTDLVRDVEFFDDKFILDTFAIIDTANEKEMSYTQDWHIDSRRLPAWLRTHPKGNKTLLNVIVPLVDFTQETGATEYISKSHNLNFDAELNLEAMSTETMAGSSGDVFIFNSNLIHRAGVNRGASRRLAIAIMFVVPWLKQQYDYAENWLEEDFEKAWGSDMSLIVGFGSQIPKSLDDWYQPSANRKNRSYK